MVFRSKIDAWLGLLLLTAGAVLAGVAVKLMLSPVGWSRLLGLPLLAVGTGLPLWLLATTRYAIGAQDLLILSGPATWRVPLREIRNVSRSRSLLSAPALSLDRLRIDFGAGRWCLVSPADREGFLRALLAAGVPETALAGVVAHPRA